MKDYLTTLLVLTCAALAIAIFVIKGGDNRQHETDAGALTDFSNRLDSAQIQLASSDGAILTLSNSLNQSRSACLDLSNQLMDAQSHMAFAAGQITNLVRQVAESESENQTLSRRVIDATNAVARLTHQLAASESSLDRVNRNYALLGTRLQQDVAERIVMERKFDNPFELRAQMQYLKTNPAKTISADSIYADLGVEVVSNGFRVLSAN